MGLATLPCKSTHATETSNATQAQRGDPSSEGPVTHVGESLQEVSSPSNLLSLHFFLIVGTTCVHQAGLFTFSTFFHPSFIFITNISFFL